MTEKKKSGKLVKKKCDLCGKMRRQLYMTRFGMRCHTCRNKGAEIIP